MAWLEKLLKRGKGRRTDEISLGDEGKPLKGHAESPERRCPSCGKNQEMTAAKQCVFCGHTF